jgi:hypothetical protein
MLAEYDSRDKLVPTSRIAVRQASTGGTTMTRINAERTVYYLTGQPLLQRADFFENDLGTLWLPEVVSFSFPAVVR